MILPFASTTTMQCSQRESTPNSRYGADEPLQASIPFAGSWRLPPLPGGAALLALRRSEEHTSELQSLTNLVCRLLLEKKKKKKKRDSSVDNTINQML